MKQNNYKWLLPIVSAILMGLSTWVLIAVVELKTTQAMILKEMMSIDKQFGRVYSFIDSQMNK